MKGLLVALLCGTVALVSVMPAHASIVNRTGSVHGNQGSVLDWNQHDTAVYVVSTLNLLRSPKGKPVSAILKNYFGVRRYTVYADAAVADLYFVELAKSDGSVVGALAYKMGWQKPMSISPLTDRLHVTKAPDNYVLAYRSDKKVLYSTFTSTLPS